MTKNIVMLVVACTMANVAGLYAQEKGPHLNQLPNDSAVKKYCSEKFADFFEDYQNYLKGEGKDIDLASDAQRCQRLQDAVIKHAGKEIGWQSHLELVLAIRILFDCVADIKPQQRNQESEYLFALARQHRLNRLDKEASEMYVRTK